MLAGGRTWVLQLGLCFEWEEQGGSEGTRWHRPQPSPILGCRSNLMGTKFTVFDNGANPDRANADWSNVRQELSAVVYVSSSTGTPPHPGDLLGRRRGGPDLHPFAGLLPGGACRDAGWAGSVPEPSFSHRWEAAAHGGCWF